ncbi:hypothetical protein Dimus_035284 [Dionaea muscipula]
MSHRILVSTAYSTSERDSAGLMNQNNELKFRLQAMEQQAQLRDGMSLTSLMLLKFEFHFFTTMSFKRFTHPLWL